MEQDEFCRFCDYGQNGLNGCINRERNSKTGLCAWSNIEGVRLYTLVEGFHIPPFSKNPVIPRSDVDALRKAVAAEKAKGVKLYRHPEKSPIETALASSVLV